VLARSLSVNEAGFSHRENGAFSIDFGIVFLLLRSRVEIEW